MRKSTLIFLALIVSTALLGLIAATAVAQPAKPAPPSEGGTFIPVVPTQTFEETFKNDTADKPKVQSDQQALLTKRYDLGNDPSNVKMSGNRKAVQQGVRVKPHGGASWASLAGMSPDEIKSKNLFPYGFRPLPHVKHPTGGMVFPKQQIDEIKKQEARDLQRFDVDFDLPDHLTPEFPPPLFLTSRPDLGDVSNGEVLTIKNYYRLLYGRSRPCRWKACGCC
jgi:cytochrome c peroxidase